MAMRANYILVDKSGYKIYYDRWGAFDMSRRLCGGPKYALEYMEGYKREDYLLDTIWAEAGWLIDVDQKVLLIYCGDDDEKFNIPLREVLLFFLKQVWHGWEVRWVDDGIAGLADYIGYPRDRVVCAYDTEYIAEELHIEEDLSYVDVVGSFRFPDGSIYLYPLLNWLECYLEKGPELLTLVDREKGFKELDLKELRDDFLVGGFHVDIPQKTLDVWTGLDMPDYVDLELKEKWQGWKINWHYSDYTIQEVCTNGKLIFPTIDVKEALEKYCQVLWDKDRIDIIKEIVAREAKRAGKEYIDRIEELDREFLVELLYETYQKSKGL